MAKQQKRAAKISAAAEDLPVVKRQNNSGTFDPDYSYVIANLKKIGILAACFIAVLIILSFIL